MVKQVDDRQGAVEFVASAAETHAARVGEAFKAHFGKHADKHLHAPDVGAALLLVARALREANGALVKASSAHERELSDDAAPRTARDGATDALVSELVGIRGTVQSVYGDAGLHALGLDGETPTEPRAMLSHARKVSERLGDPKLKWPAPVRKGVKVDASVWIDELATPIAKLETALKDVARETREAQATGDAKARAMEDNDALFTRGADFIASALRLVGDDALADQVRPSRHRPGTRAAADPPTSGGQTGTGSAGSSG